MSDDEIVHISFDFDAWFQAPSFLVDREIGQYFTHQEFRAIMFVYRHASKYITLQDAVIEPLNMTTKPQFCEFVGIDATEALPLMQSLVAVGFLVYEYATDAQIDFWSMGKNVNLEVLKTRNLGSREWEWFIKAQSSRPSAESAILPPPPKPAKQQYTYLMSGAPGLYKIGWTTNPKSRISQMGGQAYPVKYVCLIKTDNGEKLEKELHQQFASKRMRSQAEWFALTPDDVEYVKSLAVQA